MGKFVKGDVVVIPFPFSDLTGVKRRLAFVIADLPGDDIILCQITSAAPKSDSFAVALAVADFISGSLPVTSFVRRTRFLSSIRTLFCARQAVFPTQK